MEKQTNTSINDKIRWFLYQTTPSNSLVSSFQIFRDHVFSFTFIVSGLFVSRLTKTFTHTLNIKTRGANNKKCIDISTPNKYFATIIDPATNNPETSPNKAPNSLDLFQNSPRKNVATIGGAR